MKMHPLYPMRFTPAYRDYVWGGDTIARRYNRPGTPTPCAESWEISAVPGSVSVVANGPFEGESFGRIVQAFGRDLLGTAAPDPETFPLLVKILDVRDRLSVQVHPDAAAAARFGGAPKHEMWYVLDAGREARMYAGLTPGADRSDYLDRLQAYEARVGQVYDIAPGTCHAICGPALVYEVQQTSDTTYRLWDWGRPRELHTEKALAALRWDNVCMPAEPPTSSRTLVPRLKTPDFSFATLRLSRPHALHTTAAGFMILFCAEGKACLEHDGPHPLTLLPGDSVLVPARQTFSLHPMAETRLLVTTL